MKVADVTEFYSERGGGVRSYVRQKLAAAARLGYEVVVIAPGPADREEALPGGKIVWVKAPVLAPDPRYHIFFNAEPVHHILDREQPDLIEGSSPWRGGWIASSWGGQAARVLVMHADPVAQYGHTFLDCLLPRPWIDRLSAPYWRSLRALNARYDATVVAGEGLARRLEAFGLRRLQAFPFGVDRDVFAPACSDPALRKKMLAACGLPPDGRLLVAVSRHHPEKRLSTLIDAVALANRTRATGLYIIGDGPRRKQVERYATKAPHVHVAGPVAAASVPAYVASADAFLHGSGAETYGLAVAEALCCGTPVVVPDFGGAADLAGPGCSETYRLRDAAGAAAAIERLFTRDRESLREAALAYAAARIGGPESHFEALFAFYSSLVYGE